MVCPQSAGLRMEKTLFLVATTILSRFGTRSNLNVFSPFKVTLILSLRFALGKLIKSFFLQAEMPPSGYGTLILSSVKLSWEATLGKSTVFPFLKRQTYCVLEAKTVLFVFGMPIHLTVRQLSKTKAKIMKYIVWHSLIMASNASIRFLSMGDNQGKVRKRETESLHNFIKLMLFLQTLK